MRNILIIDDEKDFCYFIKSNLELDGCYKVIVENSPEKGVEAAVRGQPDLILLDIIMPKISGLQILQTLKNNRRTMAIPVIMLTAKIDDESKEEAAAFFNEDYITKPVEIDVLKSKIEAVLAKFKKAA